MKTSPVAGHPSNDDKPLPPSRIKEWFAAGGSLRTGYAGRFSRPELFPYVAKDIKPDRFNPFAFLFLLIIFAMCGGWMYFFNAAFSAGGDKPVSEFAITMTAIYSGRLTPTTTQEPTLIPTIPVYPTMEINQEVAAKPTRIPIQGAAVVLPELPTETLEPTPTIEPTPICEGCEYRAVSVKVGWFYPPLGGSHCPAGLTECAGLKLANGDDWFLSEGVAAACPDQFPMDSEIYIGEYHFICSHRLPLAACDFGLGGSTVCTVLVLSPSEILPWGQTYEGVLYWGRNGGF